MSIPISFEFFPPKTAPGIEKLQAAKHQLYALQPAFCSMTYGAGGSTRDGTFAAIQSMLDEGMDTASHFSCIGATEKTIAKQLKMLIDMGVTRLVALRGDMPSGYGGGGEFRYASDLIEFVRRETGDHFRIYAACYLEVHPEAESAQADFEALQAKVDAGADAFITQMFFNVDAYGYFLERTRKAGIDTPIIPGIMPITNNTHLLRFAENCGAEVPRWIRQYLKDFGDDTEAIADFGADIMAQLCERMLDEGAPALHFYTINQAEPTLELCRRLDIVPPQQEVLQLYAKNNEEAPKMGQMA